LIFIERIKMELKIILEFAIALTIAPLTFCWAIDLAHLIQAVHRGELDKFAKDHTMKTTTALAQPAVPAIAQLEEHRDTGFRYTSKAVIHRVSEGYVEKLGELGSLYKVDQPTSDCLADHLHALGLGNKQLKDLKAVELRKLASRMGIRGAARGRKKDLLKAMRGEHGYA
jgi:hypothetical protein